MHLYSFTYSLTPSSGDAPLQNRQKILNLEASMFKGAAEGTFDDYECPLKHHFAEGSYGREIFMPAGTVIVGKIHKHSHINVISKGKVTVLTEEGLKHYEAPLTFVSTPGTKRAVYVHEDTIWTTVHVTKETDLEKIEEQVIAKSYADLGILDAPAETLLLKKEKEL